VVPVPSRAAPRTAGLVVSRRSRRAPRRRAAVPARPAAPGGAEHPKDPSVEDLLIPGIPSLITTLVLEGTKDLSGLGKVGVGAVVGLVLWILVWHRNGGALRVPARYRRGWVAAVLTSGVVAVAVLAVTVVAFGRPTRTTAGVTVALLVVLGGGALPGRRPPGAAAAAVTGGLVGLCLGIALS
jgi:hypothetical protein